MSFDRFKQLHDEVCSALSTAQSDRPAGHGFISFSKEEWRRLIDRIVDEEDRASAHRWISIM